MDIVLGQKEQNDFISYVNSIPTAHGRPLLNWFDSIVAQARQAEASRMELEKASKTPGVVEGEAKSTDSEPNKAVESVVDRKPIIRKAPKK